MSYQDIDQESLDNIVKVEKRQSYSKFAFGATLITFALSAAVLLFNKEQVSSLIKPKSLMLDEKHNGVNVKSASYLTPLYLNQESTEYKTPDLVGRFLDKYGLEVESGTDLESVLTSEIKDGWIHAKIYSKTSCKGDEYSVGGIKVGSCIPMTDDTTSATSAFIADCVDGAVVFTSYDDVSCSSDATKSTTVISSTAGNDCKTLKPYGTTTYYVHFSCTNSREMTLEGSYDVYSISYESDSDTSDPVIFEAVGTGNCIPLEDVKISSTRKESVVFSNDANTPIVKYYESNTECSGNYPSKVELPTDSYVVMDYGEAQTIAKWYYHPSSTD